MASPEYLAWLNDPRPHAERCICGFCHTCQNKNQECSCKPRFPPRPILAQTAPATDGA